MRKYVVSAFLLATICLPWHAYGADKQDDILGQKKELEEIQQEVESGRRKLDSLKNAEMSVQKSISEYDQKIASNAKVIKRLNREQRQLKNDIGDTEAQLKSHELLLERTRRRFLGSLRQFYLAVKNLSQPLFEQPNRELEIGCQIAYLTSLANFESGNVAQAESYLTQSHQQLEQLSGESRKVTQLKKKRETATALEKSKMNREQKQLEQLRRKKTEEADRILTLQQAAREMERIIAELERERQERVPGDGDRPGGPSAFAALQGQLTSPYRGKIVVGFGYSEDPITRLKSFSPGITIKGRAGRAVVAVADGTVAYAGNLRGYGNFVIINHDGQYYTTYGGIDTTFIEANEYVLAGTTLGLSGSDGLVKFELRRGREPLDPVKWIRIDSF